MLGDKDAGYFGSEVLWADLKEMKPNIKDPFYKEAIYAWKFVKTKNMATNNEMENMHIFFQFFIYGKQWKNIEAKQYL